MGESPPPPELSGTGMGDSARGAGREVSTWMRGAGLVSSRVVLGVEAAGERRSRRWRRVLGRELESLTGTREAGSLWAAGRLERSKLEPESLLEPLSRFRSRGVSFEELS